MPTTWTDTTFDSQVYEMVQSINNLAKEHGYELR